MFKKVLSVLLAAALLLSLTACAATAPAAEGAAEAVAEAVTEAAEEAKAAQEAIANESAAEDIVTTDNSAAQDYSGDKEVVTVGLICWGYTDRLAQSYVRYLDYAGQYCGFEMEYATYATYDEILTCAENLIQSGCKIILTLGASTTLMDMCTDAGVYLAQWGSPVADEELAAYLAKSPYWVGSSICNDYETGLATAEHMYAAGCRNVVAMGTAAGNYCHDVRFKGFYDGVANHDDMNVVGEFRSATETDYPDALQNFLTLYPEMDGIFHTSLADGHMEELLQMLDTEGKLGEIPMSGFDICDTTGEGLGDGSLTYIIGGQHLEPMFLTLHALNVYDGAYEGNKDINMNLLQLGSEEDFNNYAKYIDGAGVYPYSAEELQGITFRCNPDATFEDLATMFGDYSLETIVNKNTK